MVLNVVLIIIGFILLIKGADFLVEGSVGVAKKFKIPEIIIGLTVVAIGTSMPELFVSVTSAFRGYQEIAIGNVVGSNLCNLLLILGISAIISPIIFKKETKFIEIPICLGVTILFLVLSNMGQTVSRIDSIILIVLFVCFIIYTIFMARKSSKEEESENEEKRKTIINLIYIIIGIIGLKIGGDFVVENSKTIAEYFKVSEKIIGLTIIAIGTSLPELVTSITAAIKGDTDIAIGNILGSNIANILLIIGVSGFIAPIAYDTSYNIQMTILIVATAILGLFPYIGKKDTMSRPNGIIYLIMYILYMTLLFVKQ